MAVVPIFYRYISAARNPRLWDQCLGHDIRFGDISNMFAALNELQRPLEAQRQQQNVGCCNRQTNDKFQIELDVQQFTPEEITVKYVDRSVVVEGKHEEKEDDHGYISRHFVRRYTLPQDHNENDIISSLSSDGILTITCPKKAIEQKEERAIPITRTGQKEHSVEPQSNGQKPEEPNDSNK